MCYFLYGAINDGININDYEKIVQNSGYHFYIGSKDNVNMCVEKSTSEYRITQKHCDCDTPIGTRHPNKTGLAEFAQLLQSMKTIRGIKYVMISKNWYNETNKKEECIHIDNVDIIHFLANIEDNCLYKIELYKKYY